VLGEGDEVAFRGLFGTAFPSGTPGIFKESGGTLGEVALTGDAAPGTTDTFTNFGDPVLNEAGEAAFHGFFGDASGEGIFKESEGTLGAVARRRSGARHDRDVWRLRCPEAERGG